jgi:hypothetical protein
LLYERLKRTDTQPKLFSVFSSVALSVVIKPRIVATELYRYLPYLPRQLHISFFMNVNTSVVEPEPLGAGTFGWSQSRNIEV